MRIRALLCSAALLVSLGLTVAACDDDDHDHCTSDADCPAGQMCHGLDDPDIEPHCMSMGDDDDDSGMNMDDDDSGMNMDDDDSGN